MTVICAQISREHTIHAADSLLTKGAEDGTVTPIKTNHPKIILIPRFNGAISYWGKVQHQPQDDDSDDGEWDALDWIVQNAKPVSFAPSEAEKFADSLADTTV